MFGPEAAGHATLEEAEADWQRMKMHERQRENGAPADAGVAADAISAGLEVSFPWAQRLLDGDKTIETREYALPAHWEHKPMALIESNTPASVGEGGFLLVPRRSDAAYCTLPRRNGQPTLTSTAWKPPILGLDGGMASRNTPGLCLVYAGSRRPSH